jgi:hypothetical protein
MDSILYWVKSQYQKVINKIKYLKTLVIVLS